MNTVTGDQGLAEKEITDLLFQGRVCGIKMEGNKALIKYNNIYSDHRCGGRGGEQWYFLKELTIH